MNEVPFKPGDECYAWLGGPGPDLHVFIVREIRADGGMVVYDADCIEKDMTVEPSRISAYKPMRTDIEEQSIRFTFSTESRPEGVYTMRQLLDRAHKKLGI